MQQSTTDTRQLCDGRRLRVAHLGVGLGFVVIFLLTGQYMERYLDRLQSTPDPTRMLYRSTHIYLLWSALLNLALGLYLQLFPGGWRRTIQAIGSIMVLGGPLVLTIAFFHEPSLQGLLRPLSRPAIYAAFGGLLLHALTRVALTRDRSVR
ncbi:MAG: hypothetical protein JNL39_00330 [Opitutaceae bacterium]|nr:hypothetical protein [Opitutaceae bacterium]